MNKASLVDTKRHVLPAAKYNSCVYEVNVLMRYRYVIRTIELIYADAVYAPPALEVKGSAGVFVFLRHEIHVLFLSFSREEIIVSLRAVVIRKTIVLRVVVAAGGPAPLERHLAGSCLVHRKCSGVRRWFDYCRWQNIESIRMASSI